MRAQRLTHLLLALTALVSAGSGCRTRATHDEPARAGVGFELPGTGSVARGAILTQPPGHEEVFVPYVAVGATSWVAACHDEAGTTPPLFSFETDAGGALHAAADPGLTPRDRCLAAHAVSGAPPAGLPAQTRITVQLALRAP
jgi:hypothetical protein